MKIYSIEKNKEVTIATDEATGKQNIMCDDVVLLENIEKLSPEDLMGLGFFNYESEESEEQSIKGEVIFDENSVFLTYYTPEEYEKVRLIRMASLQAFYENKINKVIRKATQDLAFGDIKTIPKDIINQRKALKDEYHKKKSVIENAKDVPELDTVMF